MTTLPHTTETLIAALEAIGNASPPAVSRDTKSAAIRALRAQIVAKRAKGWTWEQLAHHFSQAGVSVSASLLRTLCGTKWRATARNNAANAAAAPPAHASAKSPAVLPVISSATRSAAPAANTQQAPAQPDSNVGATLDATLPATSPATKAEPKAPVIAATQRSA
jgi:hypothetical protein